jgi:DNA adenine methylase
MEKLTSPLRWAGGKRWLVPYLQHSWEEYRDSRLVEPFCGGLSVALGLLPKKALLNDINPHLINFYHWLQQGMVITFERKNSKEMYYKYRKEFNGLIEKGQENTRTAAELFYYLNRTCFNGLCRFNKQGKFNVPFGSKTSINYPVDLTGFKTVLSHWKFTSSTYEDLILRDDDFLFVDPPYDVVFRDYSKDGFTWADQECLANWLSRHKGPIIVSNSATERIVTLYKKKGYKLHYMRERLYINSTGDRTPAHVVIATKNVDFRLPN